MVVSWLFKLVPIAVTAAITTPPIKAAIKPYSTAAEPRSSRK